MPPRCRYCDKAPTGVCKCCCPEHDGAIIQPKAEPTVDRPRYPRPDGGPSEREYRQSKGEI